MGSRERMIETTLHLLRSQGLTATGMSQIVEESGAPRGSIYHHFPGGKEQLAVEALQSAGEAVAAKIRKALDAHRDPARALRAYVESYAEEIRQSEFRRGCPVGNAAMDAAATSPRIREVCEAIFDEWEKLIAQGLERDGVPPAEARGIAELLLASIEGALILCRARRSTEPLDRVALHVATLVSARHGRPARRA